MCFLPKKYGDIPQRSNSHAIPSDPPTVTIIAMIKKHNPEESNDKTETKTLEHIVNKGENTSKINVCEPIYDAIRFILDESMG